MTWQHGGLRRADMLLLKRAGVQTRGVKVDGGWRVTGQKVWTSGAQHCNRGFATVRTNPDAANKTFEIFNYLNMDANSWRNGFAALAAD